MWTSTCLIVMWLYNEEIGVVEIKLIDWDTSHCRDEGKFVDNVEKSLINYLGEHIHYGAKHYHLYLAVLSHVNAKLF